LSNIVLKFFIVSLQFLLSHIFHLTNYFNYTKALQPKIPTPAATDLQSATPVIAHGNNLGRHPTLEELRSGLSDLAPDHLKAEEPSAQHTRAHYGIKTAVNRNVGGIGQEGSDVRGYIPATFGIHRKGAQQNNGVWRQVPDLRFDLLQGQVIQEKELKAVGERFGCLTEQPQQGEIHRGGPGEEDNPPGPRLNLENELQLSGQINFSEHSCVVPVKIDLLYLPLEDEPWRQQAEFPDLQPP
jgi:hypothetical protein